MAEHLRPRDLCGQCVENGVPALFLARDDDEPPISSHALQRTRDLSEQGHEEAAFPGFSVQIGGVAENVVKLGLASEIKTRLSCPFCEMVNHVLIPELSEPPYEREVIYAERSRMAPTFGLVGAANSDLTPKGDTGIYITFRGGRDLGAVKSLGCFNFRFISGSEDDAWVTNPADRKDPFRDTEHTTCAETAGMLLDMVFVAQAGNKFQKRELTERLLKAAEAQGAVQYQQVAQEPSLINRERISESSEKGEQSFHEPDNSDLQASSPFDIVLIDVKERCLVDKTTAETYLALSYVWGGDQKAKLYTNTRRSLQQSKALNTLELSKVVEDAMVFTTNLGFSYLWVDALCIEQNKDSQQKKEQLRIMDKIYQNSYVTLVAWTATCSNSPLPGVGSTTLRPQVMIRVINSPRGGEQPLILLENRLSRDLEYLPQYGTISHYDTRAWTLQERLLAERCLLFHHRETVLCVKNHKDASRAPLALGVNSLGCFDKDLFDFTTIIRDNPDFLEAVGMQFGLSGSHAPHLASYSRLIENYTKLSLTESTDRIIAVTGILDFLKPVIGDTIQGMPISHLPLSLAWGLGRHKGNSTRNTHFPSWTWAGWNVPAQCEGLYLSDILVDISTIHGSESVNGPQRLLCEVVDSAISSGGLAQIPPEPELSTIRVLHFSAKTVSSSQCWFRGLEGRSDHVFSNATDSKSCGTLDEDYDVAEMERIKSSCEFVLLSHTMAKRTQFPFEALLVCWNGPEASRIGGCSFTEDGYNSLNWVEKTISLV